MENVIYDIREVNTFKSSNLEVSEAEVWLKKMLNNRKGYKESIVNDTNYQAYLEILSVLKYFPLIELYQNSKFKIESSPFYRNLSDIQKVALYLYRNTAMDNHTAIEIPMPLNTKYLEVGLDEYWERSGNKWYLNKGSRYIIALLIKKISNIISQEMEVVSLNNETLPEIESFFSL